MILVWKNSYHTYADVYMLGYGCGMSQYHKYYDKELDRYQVLPRPYMGSFESFPGYNFVKEKWVLDWHIKPKRLSGKLLKIYNK